VIIEDKRFVEIKKREYILKKIAFDRLIIFNIVFLFLLFQSIDRIRTINSSLLQLLKLIINPSSTAESNGD
jgi:hypothetical protein